MSKQEISGYQKKLKIIKYPVRPISNAIPITKKLNQFPSLIKTKLKNSLLERLNAYRQVRGDGNCFFRAFAFSYLASIRSSNFMDNFPLFDQISLDRCNANSIPKQFKEYYKDKILKSVFKQVWQKQISFFLKQTNKNFKRALARLFAENHYLDFIVILYFRSVCLFFFEDKKQQFKDFLKGTEQQEITTYGEQSEGLILDICSKYLNAEIFIYEVRKNQVVDYKYKPLKGGVVEVYLLYYDNHYDLVELNQNVMEEYDDEKEEEYYGDVNNTFVQGACIDCNTITQISAETSLCLSCFNKSMQSLAQFIKDQFIKTQCQSCGRLKQKVSQQMLICQQCIENLQYSSINVQTKKKSVEEYKKLFKCKDCRKETTFQQLIEDRCFDCIFKMNSKIDNPSKPPANSKIKLEQNSKIKYMEAHSILNKQQSKIQNDRDHIQISQRLNQKPSTMKAQIFTSPSEISICISCKKQFKISESEGSTFCLTCKDQMLKSNFRSKFVQGQNEKKECAICKSVYHKVQKAICMKCEQKYESQSKKSNFMR